MTVKLDRAEWLQCLQVAASRIGGGADLDPEYFPAASEYCAKWADFF